MQKRMLLVVLVFVGGLMLGQSSLFRESLARAQNGNGRIYYKCVSKPDKDSKKLLGYYRKNRDGSRSEFAFRASDVSLTVSGDDLCFSWVD